MSQKRLWRRRWAIVLAAALLLCVAVALVGSDVHKMDFARLFQRAGWQLPERVLESLGIRPGDRVADIGAGNGYFTFRFAEALAPGGRVYAVEVDDERIETLEKEARERGASNVTVIEGDLDDPNLPDGGIDLVFLCNAYHHIEGRTTYFDRLRQDLADGGRVAILDLKLSPLVRLLAPAGHWTPLETMHEEMLEAGYRMDESFDFLPAQSFEVFSVASHELGRGTTPSGGAREESP
jgi:SAM-dependent methyltransferase